MKWNQVILGIILVHLSLTTVYGNELGVNDLNTIETDEDEENIKKFVTEGDIDTTWGSINNDSVRIGL